MSANWKATVDIADVWHDDDVTLSEKAQTIAARLARFTSEDDTELDEALEELLDAAASDDVRWFDSVWSGIYDWADRERVWIDTFPPRNSPPAPTTHNPDAAALGESEAGA